MWTETDRSTYRQAGDCLPSDLTDAESERLAHVPPLDLSHAKFTPAEAFAQIGEQEKPERITIGMIGSRPVLWLWGDAHRLGGAGGFLWGGDGRFGRRWVLGCWLAGKPGGPRRLHCWEGAS